MQGAFEYRNEPFGYTFMWVTLRVTQRKIDKLLSERGIGHATKKLSLLSVDISRISSETLCRYGVCGNLGLFRNPPGVKGLHIVYLEDKSFRIDSPECAD